MIVFLIKRLKQSKKINKFIFATTTLQQDDELVESVLDENVDIFRGDCNDLVNRYLNAAEQHKLDFVVRVTGDCPLVDGETLDYCIDQCVQFDGFDLATTKGNFPVGIDFEIYSSKAMHDLAKNNLTNEEREHLTLGFYQRSETYTIRKLRPPAHWPNLNQHLTVDTKEDYKFVCSIVDSFENHLINVPTLLDKAETLLHSKMN